MTFRSQLCLFCQLCHEAQTKNVMALLESPYPVNGSVVVVNQTAQIIDEAGNPVPLSEVYVHHYVSSTTFLLGSGAELRGQMSRQPVRLCVLLLSHCLPSNEALQVVLPDALKGRALPGPCACMPWCGANTAKTCACFVAWQGRNKGSACTVL